MTDTEHIPEVVVEADDLVGQIGRAVAELHEHFTEAVKAKEVGTAAQVIAAMKRAGDDLGTTYGVERRELRPIVKAGKYIGPGVLIEKDYGKTRSEWEHRALLANVLPRLIAQVPRADRDDDAAFADALVPLLLDVMTPGWKVGTRGQPAELDPITGEIVGEPATGLRQYVDPSDWCVEKSTNTVSVRLV